MTFQKRFVRNAMLKFTQFDRDQHDIEFRIIVDSPYGFKSFLIDAHSEWEAEWYAIRNGFSPIKIDRTHNDGTNRVE